MTSCIRSHTQEVNYEGCCSINDAHITSRKCSQIKYPSFLLLLAILDFSCAFKVTCFCNSIWRQ